MKTDRYSNIINNKNKSDLFFIGLDGPRPLNEEAETLIYIAIHGILKNAEVSPGHISSQL